MATIDELVIELSADTKQLQAEMRSAVAIMSKSTQDMAKSMEEMSKKGAGGASTLQTAMGTMVGFLGSQAVLGVLGTVKDALVGLMSDGIRGAAEAETAFIGFTQALATTGTYSDTAAKSFKEFADKMQNTTGISAEAVLGTGKLLASLTSLREEGLEEATTAIANMAVVMGVDMDTAAKSFSKAIGGHAEGLAKLGIQFDATGTKSENAAALIEALNSKFSGAAAAQAKTYAGSLEILKKSFGEVSESVGQTIVQNPVLISTMNSLSKIFIELSKYIEDNEAMFMDLVGNGIIGTIEALSTLVGVMNDVVKVFNVAGQYMATPFQILATQIEAAKAAASGDFTAAKDILVNGAKEIGNEWKKTLDDSPVLMGIQEKLLGVSVAARVAFADMQAGSETAATALVNPTGQITKMSEALLAAREVLKGWAMELAASADTSGERFTIEQEMLKANLDAKLISEQEYMAAREELVGQNIANEQAMLDEAASSGLIKGEALANARYALEAKSQQAALDLYSNRMKSQDALEKTREQNFKSSLGTISTLASSNNKELAALGKAAAITQATIDGYAAVQKALAQGGFLGFAMATAVGVASAANIAKIAGVPLATGIDEVPGTGFKDNFPAVLAPGERVVPRKTNEDLTSFLQGSGGGGNSTINVVVNMSDIFASDPREMGMKIIETINEAAQANGITVLGNQIR